MAIGRLRLYLLERVLGGDKFSMHRRYFDHSVFFRMTEKRSTLLILYVDDISITWDDSLNIEDLKTFLQRQFNTKDLGSTLVFLRY